MTWSHTEVSGGFSVDRVALCGNTFFRELVGARDE